MRCKSFSYFDGKEIKRAPDSQALMHEIVGKIREAFGVKRFEEGGLTYSETLDLFAHFLKHLQNKES